MTIGDVDISDPKAYNQPGFEVDLRASLDIIQGLKFTLNYYLPETGGVITRVLNRKWMPSTT